MGIAAICTSSGRISIASTMWAPSATNWASVVSAALGGAGRTRCELEDRGAGVLPPLPLSESGDAQPLVERGRGAEPCIGRRHVLREYSAAAPTRSASASTSARGVPASTGASATSSARDASRTATLAGAFPTADTIRSPCPMPARPSLSP